MQTRVAFGLIAVALCAFLTGCGKLDFGEQRDPWRDAAEQRCLRAGGLTASAFAEPLPEIDQKFTCGLEHPFKISALGQGEVSIQPAAKLGCPMNVALNKWIRDVVQPAAYANYGQPVVGLKNIASYGCRTRNNKKGAPLSEHSFGNALDVKAFYLADGREVDIRTSWKNGSPNDRAFLRQAHGGACGTFKTVLGPGSDGYHEDHFHLDLAHHDAAGDRAYCRPLPQNVPNAPPPPRYDPQPNYYPPEISQAPQQLNPPGYPQQPYPQQNYPQTAYPQDGYQQQPYPQQGPQQPGYHYPQQQQAYPPAAQYPQPQHQRPQPGYDPYAVGGPMSYAPHSKWPVSRVPTPYTGSVDGALDH
jgi:hypothetical protein